MKELSKIANWIFKNITLIFGVVIIGMDLIALGAPILAHLGFTTIAHWIYVIYGYLCHQRPWRSIHFFDYQVAWCTRDTFIYISMALSAFFIVMFKIRKVKWYIPLLALIPFALDGTIQLIAELDGVLNDKEAFFYASTNFMRMLTGSVFGAGAGLWLFSMLDGTIEEELSEQPIAKSQQPIADRRYKAIKDRSGKNILYYLVILLICLITYLGFVQIWNITSDKYKPSGLLDHKRYFPGYNYEDVGRAGHGG
ncbi:DUF2085 domain-containing protein [Candidatus Dojkabacteria bacterium]|nr:DUF2085 domain-containing protein [Candidatus Dojkabacteria bacterium]